MHAEFRRQCKWVKGAIVFYLEGGGRLSVIAGRHFFLVPPLGMRKKILVPPSAFEKKFWSPLGLHKKILPPPPRERTPPYINNETIQMTLCFMITELADYNIESYHHIHYIL